MESGLFGGVWGAPVQPSLCPFASTCKAGKVRLPICFLYKRTAPAVAAEESSDNNSLDDLFDEEMAKLGKRRKRLPSKHMRDAGAQQVKV